MSRDRPAVDDHLRFALAATDTGLWDWDRSSDTLSWDETCDRLFGHESGAFPGTYDAFLDCMLAEEREAVDAQITTAIETGNRFEVEFRIERDGERRWIRSRGTVEAEAGEPTRLIGTHTDVTAERNRERELESYRKLFEKTTDCVVEIERVDDDYLIRRVNAAFEEIFDYTEPEVRGEDIHDALTPEEHRDAGMEIKQEYLKGNQPVVEVTRNTADGQREFLMRAVNFGDRFYVIYTDITEWKTAERAIEKAREKLRHVLDLIPDPIYAKNRDDEVLLSNAANAELHGMTRDEIEGMREYDIESDVENIEDFDQYRQQEVEVMETGETLTREERLADPNGHHHVFQVIRMPFEPIGTDEKAVLGYARDVTDRKEYEQQLEELNTWLQLALAETNTGVWEWDFDTDDVIWDEISEQLFGYDSDEFPGTFAGFADRVPGEDIEQVHEQVDHAIETGEQYRAEFRVRPPESDQRWMQARGVVQYDDEGTPSRMIGVQTDITERKEREQELRRQNQRLERFANVVSHDLRNPLTVAMGRMELIDNDEHGPIIEDNLARMEVIIEHVLTLAREGQPIEETERFRLDAFANEAWRQVETGEATLSCPDSVIIEANRNRSKQLFENLFHNSIEHVGDDVAIRVGSLTDGFYIEDNGPGIPEDERESVFDAGYTTNKNGTGFGLNIVAEIVRAHGWTVAITDGTDDGARFEFTRLASEPVVQ